MRCGISIARTEPCVKLTSPAVTEKCKWCQKPDLLVPGLGIATAGRAVCPPYHRLQSSTVDHKIYLRTGRHYTGALFFQSFTYSSPSASRQKPWICPDTPKRIDRYRFTQTGTQTHLKQLHEKIKRFHSGQSPFGFP